MYKNLVVLVIDDEQAILKTLQEALQDEGYVTHTLADASKAISVIGKLVPDVIFLDIFMPQINGLDLLSAIKKEYPQQKVIIISGFGNIPMALQAVNKGAIDFIEKPLNLDDILSKLSGLKTGAEASDDPIVCDYDYERYGVTGKSFLFQELMSHVQRVEGLKIPLLIYGAYGAGKSLIARYIHQRRLEKLGVGSGEFIEINCAGVPDLSQLDELVSSYKTFYFKNINELSREDQKRVLSFIDCWQHDFVKIIASTSASLFELAKQGKFNDSLFHALNATPIEVPALSKRRFDIPLLLDFFLKRENKEQNKNVSFSSATIRYLRNYNWEANVAELEQFVEKVVFGVLEYNFVVNPEDARQYLIEKNGAVIDEQVFISFNTFRDAASAFERDFLTYHLRNSYYDLTQVSERLSLNIPELRAKMSSLNIEMGKTGNR